MTIKIISVSFTSDGAEVILGIALSNGDDTEKRRLYLPSEKYVELGLSKGKLLSEELFDELFSMSEKYRAIKKGSELLAYSAQSKKQLSEKLKMKGFDRESAESAVNYLENRNFIDESRNIQKLVASGLKKLWGRKRIYAELLKKGYDRELASRELSEISEGELLKNCVLLIRKKWGALPHDGTELAKIQNSLVRYGYSYSEIQKAFNKIK